MLMHRLSQNCTTGCLRTVQSFMECTFLPRPRPLPLPLPRPLPLPLAALPPRFPFPEDLFTVFASSSSPYSMNNSHHTEALRLCVHVYKISGFISAPHPSGQSGLPNLALLPVYAAQVLGPSNHIQHLSGTRQQSNDLAGPRQLCT